MTITIYHNPRCSKSRQTLALIEAAGKTPEIILYQETPLKSDEIKRLLGLLGLENPRDLMRRGEEAYRVLNLKEETNSEVLIKAMVENPKLIERPIVVSGSTAILGRPPENVNKFL